MCSVDTLLDAILYYAICNRANAGCVSDLLPCAEATRCSGRGVV